MQNTMSSTFIINNQAEQDTSIIKLVDGILHTAIAQGASDIHFEPYAEKYRIRLRIDGMLYLAAEHDLAIAPRVSARIKVMAKLDIAEKRLPQDGRFTYVLDHDRTPLSSLQSQSQRRLDCRVGSCPTICGEKIVIRILSPPDTSLNINQLGLDVKQQQLFLKAIQATQGMILVTGPTGSGKTVTLYTALNFLNTMERNISTVEDPAEIHLPGINQVEINNKTDLTFATTLRAFLRQDPDVIMVGEIRDLETAQIAIHAAQTGHLVLATLHTNTAAESITRLLNMGISKFNLATSIKLIIAQRLLRVLCPSCKKKSQVVGCSFCKNGYKGRIGIFELLPISQEISNIILEDGNVLTLEQCACRNGMALLQEAATQKIISGITSAEEVNRVLGFSLE
ncbi:MAG: ATPase, T2SS/T4P/T4SS family [Legionellales bacterium]|jgi:type IV pilus assembly protein PilB